MPKLAAVVAVAVLVLACGGSKKDPDQPGDGSDAGGGGGAGNGSAVTAGDGSGGGGVAATGVITRAECETMIGHILDIGAAAQPAEKRPTPEALATAKQNLIDDEEGMKQCMAFDRAVHTCVMTATTVPAIEKCLGGQ